MQFSAPSQKIRTPPVTTGHRAPISRRGLRWTLVALLVAVAIQQGVTSGAFRTWLSQSDSTAADLVRRSLGVTHVSPTP